MTESMNMLNKRLRHLKDRNFSERSEFINEIKFLDELKSALKSENAKVLGADGWLEWVEHESGLTTVKLRRAIAEARQELGALDSKTKGDSSQK